MFKDLKEYQEITQIYNDSVNISEEQREINKIFIEEGFTSEEIEYLEENFDELWENELAEFTQECIAESFEGQDLTEEQIQQIDEVLGLKLLAKGITKAAPIASKGLRKANIGIKKGLRAVSRKVSGGAKAIKTGIKDTAAGAVSLGKSALKKGFGAIKKAAPIIGKGALLGTGAALPLAGAMMGVNALRNRGKKAREAKAAGKAAADAALDAKIKKGIKDSGMKAGQGTAMTMKGIKQASYNRGLKAAQDKAKKAGEAGAKGAENIKSTTTTTKSKPMSKIEFQNRKRFGDKAIDQKKAMNVDFQGMKKGKMTKQEFIDKYPKSQTAKKYNQSDKAYRDYKKGLKKEDIEHLDAYDMVLEYLFATEQVTTLEEANYIMMEMDQQTVGEIVTEVKQELHELLPLAGLALGGLAVNALRKRGKAKRMGKGGSPFSPAGTAAGRAANMPMKKKPGDAAAKGAKNISSGAGAAGKLGSAAGKLGSAMGAALSGAAGGKKKLEYGLGPGKALIHYAPTKKRAAEVAGSKAGKAASTMGKPKPQAGTGRPSPRPPHGRRRDGGSIGGGNVKKPKVDLTGKTKAQIMALKRLGKI